MRWLAVAAAILGGTAGCGDGKATSAVDAGLADAPVVPSADAPASPDAPAVLPPDAAPLPDAPWAPPVRVNTMLAGTQYFPAVAADGAGTVWVTWYDYGSSAPGQYDSEVRLRGFGEDGVARQPVELTANATTIFAQRYPAIAGSRDGVVLAWESHVGLDPDQRAVMARGFSTAGDPGSDRDLEVGGTTAAEKRPAIAADPVSGRFLVAWAETSMYLRRFEADGTPIDDAPLLVANPWDLVPDGGDTIANWPAVKWDAAGGEFLVVFDVDKHGPPVYGEATIFARRYPTAGASPDPAAVALDPATPGGDLYPDVAVFPDGGFVAVWSSYGGTTDGSAGRIVARRFAGPDQPLDLDGFTVNTTTRDDQQSPHVAAGCGGAWMVVWNDWSRSTPDGKINDARARRFARDGTALDQDDWLVEDGETRETSLPVVTATTRGFAVAYEVYDQTPDQGYDVWLRLIDESGCQLR
jgi:hypothetical protein